MLPLPKLLSLFVCGVLLHLLHTNQTTTIAGLIRQGSKAFPMAMDLDKAVTSKEVTVPLDAMIWTCKDATKLKE